MLENIGDHVTKKNVYIIVVILVVAWLVKEYVLDVLDERKIRSLGGHAAKVKNRLPWGMAAPSYIFFLH